MKSSYGFRLTFVNDIALLKTEEFIKFNEIISPICWSLPSYEKINDETCVAIGWGKLCTFDFCKLNYIV